MANYLHIQSKDLDYDPNALLNAVINHLGLKNDASLCRVLGVAPLVISKIRHASLPIGATTLISMHEATGLSIKELRALMGDRRPFFHDFEANGQRTQLDSPEQKRKDEARILVKLHQSLNAEGREKLLQLSKRLVSLNDSSYENIAENL